MSLNLVLVGLVFEGPVSRLENIATGLDQDQKKLDILHAVMSSLIYQRLILFTIFIDWFIMMTIAKVHQMEEYAVYWGNKTAIIMYNIPKGTWYGKRLDVKFSNIFFHNILYMVKFVKMRRIQWYYFHSVKHMKKWPLRKDTVLEF